MATGCHVASAAHFYMLGVTTLEQRPAETVDVEKTYSAPARRQVCV